MHHGLTRFNNSILFSANDGTHGEELWISDGTENGTFMLKDMDEGGEDSDSDPWGFLDAGDVAYFSSSDDSEDRDFGRQMELPMEQFELRTLFQMEVLTQIG